MLSHLGIANNTLRDDPEVVASGEAGLATSLQNYLGLALPQVRQSSREVQKKVSQRLLRA
jgi:hypothetical protein